MKLKVCGLKNENNILEIAALNPDYIGFIFYEKSPRFFNEDKLPTLPKNIEKVGVFVNATLEEIEKKILKYDLNVVQLHGEESVTLCEKLKNHEVKIIKAFGTKEVSDINAAVSYENVCDYFLFDTKGVHYGGNGFAFDWDILQAYKGNTPIFLSGGIGLEDITKIKKLPFPIHAIDVNSKFEIEPGLKNVSLIQKLQHEIYY